MMSILAVSSVSYYCPLGFLLGGRNNLAPLINKKCHMEGTVGANLLSWCTSLEVNLACLHRRRPVSGRAGRRPQLPHTGLDGGLLALDIRGLHWDDESGISVQ